MERQYVETRHGKMSFLVRNGEYPLIFLHGLGGTGNNWTRLNSYLDSRFEVVMVDMIGHGHSFQGDEDYTVKMQCESLQDLISARNYERYALAGNSYGGWVSLTFALGYGSPDYLILIDSAGLNSVSGKPPDDVDEFVDRLVKMNKFNRREVLKKIMLNNISGREKFSPDKLDNFRSKVAIIWGERDRVIDPSYAAILNEHIKNSELFLIPDAGHTPYTTHPSEVSRILNEFVRVQ